MKNIIDAFVEDFEEQDRKSHSDQPIEECLRDLNVWNILSDVIYHAAGENLKICYLYCSETKAVLKSWADKNGLARLKNVSSLSCDEE